MILTTLTPLEKATRKLFALAVSPYATRDGEIMHHAGITYSVTELGKETPFDRYQVVIRVDGHYFGLVATKDESKV